MYQTSINAHHRSSRGKLKSNYRGVHDPELFEAGYFTTNSDATVSRRGKEDYNFDYESAELYDGIDWRQRKPNQPLPKFNYAAVNTAILRKPIRRSVDCPPPLIQNP